MPTAFLTSILVALAATGEKAAGLQVYNCDGPNTTYQVISMLEPEGCPDPEKDYEEPQLEVVQVLQSQKEAHVSAYRCLVKRTIRVTRCGFTSISYGTNIVEWRRTLAIDEKDCKNLIKTKQIKLGRKGEEKTLTLRRSGTLTATIFTRGNLDTEGNCKYANFVSGGGHYMKSYEQTTYEIAAETVKAQYRSLVDTIVLEGGVRGRYSDGHLHDNQLGTVVWDTRLANCTDTYSQVYMGEVRLFKHKERKDQGGPALLGNSIVMLDHEIGEAAGVQEAKYAGLVLRYPEDVCGHRCHATQVASLIVCFVKDNQTVGEVKWQMDFPVHLIAQQTQLGYTHLATNLRMYRSFATIHRKICEIERKTLENALTTLAGGQNRYALHSLLGPGHRVTRLGAVAYVYKCKPVNAARAEHRNCTQEIPVRLGNTNRTIRFADPITRVLSEYATIVPCDSLAPVRWFVDGVWFCAHPEVEICAVKPQQLAPGPYQLEPGDFTLGLSGGIISEDQMERHRMAELILHSREAQSTANSAYANQHGHRDEDGVWVFGPSISDQALRAMEHNFLTKVSILIPIIGRAWPWIAEIGMCLALIQSLGGCLARIYLAYRMKGFGLWLILATLGIAMTLVVIPVTILRRIWADLASGGIPGVSAADDPDDSDLRGPKPTPRAPEPPAQGWKALQEQLGQIDEPPVKRMACS